MSPEKIILVLCLGALTAFVVDRFRKLPKSVFVFFAVAIVSSVCWSILESGSGKDVAVEKGVSSEVPLVFVGTTTDVPVVPGETRVSLPVLISGKRKFDCVRFVFKAENLSVSEQGFIDKVKFSLLYPDGTLSAASGLVMERSEDFSFPSRFVIKVFFPASENPSDNVRCIIENGFSESFMASEISVAARPASISDETVGEGGSE